MKSLLLLLTWQEKRTQMIPQCILAVLPADTIWNPDNTPLNLPHPKSRLFYPWICSVIVPMSLPVSFVSPLPSLKSLLFLSLADPSLFSSTPHCTPSASPVSLATLKTAPGCFPQFHLWLSWRLRWSGIWIPWGQAVPPMHGLLEESDAV